MVNPPLSYVWLLFGLASRVAPVSMVPLLIRYIDPADVDWFVLVQTNASLISVLLASSQSTFIQQNYSRQSHYDIVAITTLAPLTLLAVGVAISFAVATDLKTLLYSLLLASAIAFVPQSQAILRCAGLYGRAIVADIVRMTMFLSYAACVIYYSDTSAAHAVIITTIYYAIPFIFTASGRVFFSDISSMFSKWLSSIPYMLAITLSSLLAGASWASIRYALFVYGNPGALAVFSAMFSIASLSAILTDFMYIRYGQNIVVAARDGDRDTLLSQARRCGILITLISLVSLSVTSAYGIFQFHDSKESVFILGLFIVFGLFLRGIYIFFQNMLIGMKVSHMDLAASASALLISLLISPYVLPWSSVIGGGIIFFSLSCVYAVILSRAITILGRRR